MHPEVIFLREQARRCRELANDLDSKTRQALLDIAAEHDRRADRIEAAEDKR